MGKQDQYDFGGADDDLPADPAEDDSPDGDAAPSAVDGGSAHDSAAHAQADVGELDVSNLPLKLRRNNVTDFRDNKTIKVLPETAKAMENDALRFLSDEFEDETMHKSDAFEIIVWNGLYDANGNIDTEGLKQQAKKMGYGLGVGDD